jgi:N utilization substance protein B
MMDNFSLIFPLSKNKEIKGNRRLAREKALQVITTYLISDESLIRSFDHIFYRDFNFGDGDEHYEKILTQAEVVEVESDTAIIWESEEIDFAFSLVEKTLETRDIVDEYITAVAENWELDRIASLDRILIEMAVVELIYFPEIPTKVSINESIEIAKRYSTDKSGNFINGVLDKILGKLESESKINKTGRGLQNK